MITLTGMFPACGSCDQAGRLSTFSVASWYESAQAMPRQAGSLTGIDLPGIQSQRSASHDATALLCVNRILDTEADLSRVNGARYPGLTGG
ncbi:MAG TPA: hypothetical protein VGC09_06095 [Rhodopila sp.]